MVLRCSLALLVLFAATPAGNAQEVAVRPGQVVPPRDVRPQGAAEGTAVLRGRITDAASGLPIRRATIELAGRSTRGEPRGATTDDQGRFEFTDLPAGEYLVMVRKPGYASRGYGQRRWNESPRPLTLRAGERFDKCDVALERGGVITGRVFDEIGEPVLEATVRVLRHNWFRGRKRLVPAGAGTTNDLGVFRVFGLQPGEYVVQASIRASSRWLRDNAPVDYAPTFYPGTADAASALAVEVTPGQESIADVSLQTVRVAGIAGQVLSGSGRPVTGGRVMAVLQAEGDQGVFGGQPRSASIKPDGTFQMTGLAPGTYLLSASVADAGFGPSDGREMAQQLVTVAGEPVHGVTLALAPGGVARGRVVVEGVAPASLAGLRVFARSADDGAVVMMGGGSAPAVAPDGSFEVRGLVGRRLLSLIGGGPLAQGWTVKAVVLGGRDVQDAGIDFVPGRTVSGIEIVLTRESAAISGTVTDDRGQRVTDYSVLAFSEDREKWFLPSMRWLRSARADQDGLFKLEGLAPGRFLVVAVDGLDAGALGDPDEIERLRGSAVEVSLTGAEKKTVTLTLARP